MMRVLASTVLLGIGIASIAQDRARYKALAEEARELLAGKHYQASAARFSAAFEALGWKGYPEDRIAAARAWSMSGVPDSAFSNLFRIAERLRFSDVDLLLTESDLKPLHATPRWQELVTLVQRNRDQKEANLDRPLAALLDSIHEEDQRLRRTIGEVEGRHGRGSPELKALFTDMARKDSSNLVVVSHILDTRGWLGPLEVGDRGSSTLFLVIQHADLRTQEKYLPMMRDAVSNGHASASRLALLEDRVLLRNGKRQIYGSQIGRFKDGESYLSPLEDAKNVDERRRTVGLPPLAEDLMNWNIQWDPEAYEKSLPALEERIKADHK